MPWKLKQDSLTYCDFIFTDGNIRRFYSLDWASRYSKSRDKERGIKRLRELITKYGPSVKRAFIRENDGSKTIIEQYENGIRVD